MKEENRKANRGRKKIELDLLFGVLLLALLVCVTFLQVLFRFVFNLPLAWSEELSRFSYIFMVGLAASVAIRERSMLRIELFRSLLPKPNKHPGDSGRPFAARLVKTPQALGAAHIFLEKLPELIGLLFTLFVAVYTLYPLVNAFRVGQLSPALRLPVGILYAVQAALYLLMSIRYFVRLFGPKASQGSQCSQHPCPTLGPYKN